MPSQKHQRNWKLLIVFIVLATVVMGLYLLMAPIRDSKQLEQALIDQFGHSSDYVPAASGFVPAERMEHFILVRQSVQTSCTDFQTVLKEIRAFEAPDTYKELPADEKMEQGISGFKNMLSAAPKFLEFINQRNSTLSSQEMGLGEYIYIYLAVYTEQLAGEADSAYAGTEEAYVSPRVRAEFSKMLTHQLDAIEAAGSADIRDGLEQAITSEITRLMQDNNEPPWAHGLPESLQESIAPFQQRLENLYCSGIVKIELMQKNKGLEFRG